MSWWSYFGYTDPVEEQKPKDAQPDQLENKLDTQPDQLENKLDSKDQLETTLDSKDQLAVPRQDSQTDLTTVLDSRSDQLTTTMSILARRARVLVDVENCNYPHCRKSQFCSHVRSLLNKVEITKGRENKKVICYQVFDYIVSHRMTFWKLAYTGFPKATLIKICELQDHGMDLESHYRKLYPNAPPFETRPTYQRNFLPNIQVFTIDQR